MPCRGGTASRKGTFFNLRTLGARERKGTGEDTTEAGGYVTGGFQDDAKQKFKKTSQWLEKRRKK